VNNEPVRVRTLIADAVRQLSAAGVPSPHADAEALLALVLNVSRMQLVLQDVVDPDDANEFASLVARRCSRIPLQHITGEAAFRYLTLAVGRGVFVPRPETELVAETAIRELRGRAAETIAVDLCSGSGALAISIATEVDNVDVHAVELSDGAIPWLTRNVDAHSSQLADRFSRITVHHASVAQVDEKLSELAGRVDVVVSNPPYIPDAAAPVDIEVRDHDPALALFGGRDGLDVVRDVIAVAANLLAPGGLLIIEHADSQGDAAGMAGVPGLLKAIPTQWTGVRDHADLSQRPRFTEARRR